VPEESAGTQRRGERRARDRRAHQNDLRKFRRRTFSASLRFQFNRNCIVPAQIAAGGISLYGFMAIFRFPRRWTHPRTVEQFFGKTAASMRYEMGGMNADNFIWGLSWLILICLLASM